MASEHYHRLLPAVLLVAFAIGSPLARAQCSDMDGDGFFHESGCDTDQDCNDANSAVYPGAVEVCDGYDNDCDLQIDNDAACDGTCDLPARTGSVSLVSGFTAREPSIAWTGTEYGVVWSDDQAGSRHIYFARFDASGNKIGSDVQVTTNVDAWYPSVVWTGSEFGVVWNDTSSGDWEIYHARLDGAGAKIGAESLVSAASADSAFPSFAWTGAEYGVVWEDYRHGDAEIYFARVDRTGAKIGSDVRLTNAAEDSWEPVLVWTGSEYGVTWYDFRTGSQVLFTRVDAEGNEIGDDVEVTSATDWAQTPWLAWDGSRYGVVWEDYRDGVNPEIYFARLNSSGSQIGQDTRVTNDPTSSRIPRLAWTGSEYGVVWLDYRTGVVEAYLARLSAAGSKSGDDVRLTFSDDDAHSPALAWNGVDFGVVWRDAATSSSDVFFARIRCDCDDADGDGASPTCSSDCDDTNPNCTFDCTDGDGDGYCVAFDCDDSLAACTDDCSDADGDGWTGCQGDCNDGDASTNPGAPERSCDAEDNDCDPGTPDVFDGDGDGVTCDADCNDSDPEQFPGNVDLCDGVDNDCDGPIDEDEVCDTSCDLPGAAGDVVRLTTGLSKNPSAVQKGSGYAVVWSDQRIGVSNPEIYFTRLDSSGNKIGGDVRVSETTGSSVEPQLVWTGFEYGVVWLDTTNGFQQIWFARLDAAGNRLGPERQVTAPPVEPRSPSLVWSGTEYGLAWADARPNATEDIYFARLDETGAMIGSEVQVTDQAYDDESPHLVWTGSEYGLVWDQSRSVYFTRLDASGDIIGGNVQVSTTGRRPHLVWNGSGYGVVWTEPTHLARLDASGNVLSDLLLSPTGWHSWLAWTGSEYGLIFGSQTTVVFGRFDGSGNLVGPWTNVILGTTTNRLNDPLVLWNFGEYGVIWRYETDRQIAFRPVECNCPNPDGDFATTCWPDCDETNALVYPGAYQACDGLNNNCDDPSWPTVPPDESDSDGDSVSICDGDCDDTSASIFPGAPQLCDGLNTDCHDPDWPDLPQDEIDADGDGYRTCEGDCDDARGMVNPGGSEICNGLDDDCNSLIDDDENGEDSDGDAVHNRCDNCPSVDNATQTDADFDSVGDGCDNCPANANASQADFDSDQEGDHCDLDDGMIYIYFDGSDPVEWHAEGFSLWNVYRGDVGVLRSSGVYTQALGSNPVADQSCGLVGASLEDLDPLPSRTVAFYLATGVGVVETGLGPDSDGNERLNDNPCSP